MASKALLMADGLRLASPFPTAFVASKPSLYLHAAVTFPRPLVPRLSSTLSRRKILPFVPLVARTSDWALQEAEEELIRPEDAQLEGEEDEGEEAAGAEAGLSEWESEGGEDAAVEESEGEGEGEAYAEPPEDAKVFVGNLPYDMDSEKLAELFDKAGIVEVAEVIYNRETEQSRGFGFVTMSTVEETEKAIDMFNRYEVNGRPLTVNKAAPRGGGARVERTPPRFGSSFRLYVGNLPWQVDDARLEQLFRKHGDVVDARVVYDRESGRSRGFAFVTMASQSAMEDAIDALDGQSLDGRALRVNAAEERPRRSSF